MRRGEVLHTDRFHAVVRGRSACSGDDLIDGVAVGGGGADAHVGGVEGGVQLLRVLDDGELATGSLQMVKRNIKGKNINRMLKKMQTQTE